MLMPERTVEIVTLRVLAVARTRKPRQIAATPRRGDGSHARIGTHRIFEDGGWRRGTLYDRARLLPGDHFAGPAVIVELSATTYLPSGWLAEVDGFSNLRLAPTSSQLKRGGR